MMTVVKCRELFDSIKDELRNQVSLWNYHLMHDRAMNLSLQRKAESAIEKSKILQKIRIRHAERLLRDLQTGNPIRRDVEKEIKVYWATIVPAIKDALDSFREINHIRKYPDQINKLEIPEELDVSILAASELAAESDCKSVSTEVARSSTESTFSTMTGPPSHFRTQTRRSKSRNKFPR